MTRICGLCAGTGRVMQAGGSPRDAGRVVGCPRCKNRAARPEMNRAIFETLADAGLDPAIDAGGRAVMLRDLVLRFGAGLTFGLGLGVGAVVGGYVAFAAFA